MAVIRKIKSKGEWVLPDGHTIHNPNDFTIKIVLLNKDEKQTSAKGAVTIPEGNKNENEQPKK